MSSRDETRYMGNPKLPTTKAQFDYVSDGGVKLHHIDKSSKSLMHFASNFFYIIDSNYYLCKDVDTDMTSHKGHRTVEEGVKSIVFAATLPPNTNIKGEYIWEDSTVTSWVEENVNLFY